MWLILTLFSFVLLFGKTTMQAEPLADSILGKSDSSSNKPDTTKSAVHDSSWRAPGFVEPTTPLGLDPRLDSIIRPWLGTRHRYGQESKAGIDCSGFVQVVLKAYLNVKTERSSAAAFKKGEVVEESDLLPGDVIFFANHHKRIDHSGVWIGGGRFAHASTSYGVEVTELDADPYWHGHFKGGRRFAYNPAFPPPDPIPAFQESTAVADTAHKDVVLPPITRITKHDKHRVSRSTRRIRRKRRSTSVRKKHHHPAS